MPLVSEGYDIELPELVRVAAHDVDAERLRRHKENGEEHEV